MNNQEISNVLLTHLEARVLSLRKKEHQNVEEAGVSVIVNFQKPCACVFVMPFKLGQELIVNHQSPETRVDAETASSKRPQRKEESTHRWSQMCSPQFSSE